MDGTKLTKEAFLECVKDHAIKIIRDDGLCSAGCGCGLDCFMPCTDEIRQNCTPAYARAQKCSECESYETCDYADNSEDKKTCYFTSKEKC